MHIQICRENGIAMSKRCWESVRELVMPTLVPCLRKPSRESLTRYNLFYIIVEIFFSLAVISLILCARPSWRLAAHLEGVLAPFFQPRAMAAVVSLVGLPGAVFGWLISHMEDKVCGVRMSQLIDWAYPNFFISYFCFFITLSIIAVFSGNVGLFWPTLYAFCGVLIALCLLCWVCYRFVMRSDFRETLAFEYYENLLAYARGDDDKVGKTLLNTADYARFLLAQEHRNPIPYTVGLWLKAFSEDRRVPDMEQSASAYWQEEEDALIHHSALFRSVWAALLPKGLSDPQDIALLHSTLRELDVASGPIQNAKEECVSYGREAVLLGLAQFLMELGQKGRDWEAERFCALAYGQQKSPAVQELVCACLTMLSVEWVNDTSSARWALSTAAKSLMSILEQCLVEDGEGKGETPLAAFLLHAQWIARRARQMNAGTYILRVSGLLGLENLSRNSFLDCTAPKDQKDLLLSLLCLAVWEEEDKTERRSESDHGST